MEALIQRQIMSDTILPALRRMSEVWEVANDPRVDLLNGQGSRGGSFNCHEDEAGEGIRRFCVYVGGRGRRRLTGRAGRGGHAGHWGRGFYFSLWAKNII